jgi:Flp pilus assembly protein protease CpaA
VALYLLWRSNVVGGGDAKLMMGLFALFPEPQFLLLFAVVGLAVRMPFMLRKYWRRKPSDLLAGASERLRTGQLVPSGEELQERGRSYAWMYCLPGVIYLWLLWI